jgi:hypothetical protein
MRPKVLARFTSEAGPVFLVERPIGRGHVVFAASGVLSNWNTLSKTNAIVMFDRILRSRMQATLPTRNYPGVERIAVPLPGGAREDRIVLFRPGQGTRGESLDSGFLGTDQLGVSIDRPVERGIYRLQALGSMAAAAGSADPPPRWQLELAVNGDEVESDLEPLARPVFEQQAVSKQLRWIDATEEISLAGARIRGQDLWWWLTLLVLLLLLAELGIILWPAMSDHHPPSAGQEAAGVAGVLP